VPAADNIYSSFFSPLSLRTIAASACPGKAVFYLPKINIKHKNNNKNNDLIYFRQNCGGDLRGKKQLNFDV